MSRAKLKMKTTLTFTDIQAKNPFYRVILVFCFYLSFVKYLVIIFLLELKIKKKLFEVVDFLRKPFYISDEVL